jgi:acetyltransferase-like isoleucine patch superfamily enzyme
MTGVKIGKNCMISLRAKIDSRRGTIVIGDNSSVTYGCVILSHDATVERINPEKKSQGMVRIGSNVFIGVCSVVMPNITIGDNSVVGAGSVVTKDVPPWTVVAGNPAKEIRKIG